MFSEYSHSVLAELQNREDLGDGHEFADDFRRWASTIPAW